MKVILFVGYSGSGKTTAIASVTRALKRRGGKVATIKHIPHSDFTIDTRGKDTWLHAASGASIVVSLAPKELAIIWKKDTTTMRLDNVLGALRREKVDYVLVEGLYRRLSLRKGVVRVLCASSMRDARSFIKNMRPRPDFITGRLARRSSGKSFGGIPLVEFPKDFSKFLRMIG